MSDDFFQSDLSFLDCDTQVQKSTKTASAKSNGKVYSVGGIEYRICRDEQTRAKISVIVRDIWKDNDARREATSQKHKGKLVSTESRAKISQANKGRVRSEQERQKLASWRASLPGGGPRAKPIQTPYGQFPSKALANEALTAQGIGNASKKISKWLKTDPTNYYYLPKDTK